ncbi:MAG: glycosyltransferase family 2 protein [Deltaproteobacteria bacterium]|nr:glycosyltransferase family 2 protein [Deltaproteobacteria bacterium]
MNRSPTLPDVPAADARPFLSLVVPVFNEVESLGPMHQAVVAALEPWGKTWEAIYVDDGSSDGSFEVLRGLCERDPRVKAVRFRRNFGQTAAMAAGFAHAAGEVICPIDADLQNDPGDIPMLVAKLDEGYDLVAGIREKRQDKALTVVIPSRIANRIIARVTGVALQDNGCTLKAFRAEVLHDVRLYGEAHRFIAAFAAMAGARIAQLPVRHHARRWGQSKYNLSKTFRVVLDLITVRFLLAYATKPTYFFGRFAFGCFGLGGAALVWTLVQKFGFGIFVKDQPMFLVGIFFLLSGMQLLLFGLLAELNMRTYYESQGKPTYFVRERINVGTPARP